MASRKILHVFVLVSMLASLLLASGVSAVSAQNAPAPLSVGSSSVSAAPISPVDETKVPHYFGPWPNWANSSYTLPDVAVEILGDGAGATATATVGANGVVTAITITGPGAGYTAATVSITGAGTGATADAVVTGSGMVTGITVDTAGAGYTTPVLTISGGGATTNATATAYGGVDAVALTNPGAGYTMPTVDFDYPNDPNGMIAKAHAVCIEAGCHPTTEGATVTITGILVDDPGSGYSQAPNVVIRDGTQFEPLNRRAFNAAQAARAQALASPQAGPLSSKAREGLAPTATTVATAEATLTIQNVGMDVFGAGYTSVPTVTITDSTGVGAGATAHATIDAGGVTAINLTAGGSGYLTPGGIKKFQDSLPMLCDPSVGCADNNLGQHIPLAVPDTTTFPGADYYVIALVQHREQMNSSLPATGTLLREYVQLETTDNASWSKHVQLQTALKDGTTTPALMPDGSQAVGVDDPHFLGPIIQANKDRPVRIVFYNLLPTGVAGELFIPMDSTFMGAGMGPMEMGPSMDMGSVTDEVRNPMCSEAGLTDMMRMDCFAQTRATLHLHGGITPWISDGSPHQWITPANEQTSWPEGVAVRQVPDMVGGARPAGVPDCSANNDGCMTFYYTNQQSARLMFYHDHAWGITRLNVYAGEAAGYIIRDATEKRLIDAGLIPSGANEIPLVIQDRTFVPNDAQLYGDVANGVYGQDPAWDKTRWGGEGDLWYEHVYMPAQNPSDPSGLSTVGRWFYGAWFWPPADLVYPAISNPYYNMDPKGADGIRGTGDDWQTPLATPCRLDDSATWQYDTDPFCEPPQIPGTPNNSAGMEQFNDTPIVNGTAYPTMTVDPKAYRLRILNAANDRFWNLQWYVGDPTTADPVLGPTEVALNPAELAAAQLDPIVSPTPDTSISPPGPSWIQIGTEGGFLPAPVVVPNQPTTWITDPTRFDVGNVDLHAMLVGPAERADVIVDFSQFAGKTLILYNDAPAAFPARIATYDYYTGAPDLSPAGAPGILPGYGPNTRTIMQVKVSGTVNGTPFNLNALKNAFSHKADGSGVFESGQNPIIVGQAGYNSAYGKSFVSGSWCNDPAAPTGTPCDGFARISEQGHDTFKFDTLVGPQLGVRIEPKALHDETNATSFEPWGRMSGNLGIEVVPASPLTQNVGLYPFVNPPTEIFDGTNLPTTDHITPISVSDDGTQIWKFTHNGVDTHPLHFHLYDLQLLSRVTWDNIILAPEPTELGWKDTVRTSPLEDTYFAIRPIIPTFPFEIPNSIRTLSPEMPVGSMGGPGMFNNIDTNGNPTDPIVNKLVNFGWEYMMHCHILSHEEMDMMRPQSVTMPPNQPTWSNWTVTGGGANRSLTLNWNDNSIAETAYVVQMTADDGATWTDVTTVSSPLDQPNTKGVRSAVDTNFGRHLMNQYRVVAQNTVGYGGAFPSVTAQSIAAPTPLTAPTSVTAIAARAGSRVRIGVTWTDAATNELGYVIQRAANASFTAGVVTSTVGPNATAFQTGNIARGAYYFRVRAFSPLGASDWVNATPFPITTP